MEHFNICLLSASLTQSPSNSLEICLSSIDSLSRLTPSEGADCALRWLGLAFGVQSRLLMFRSPSRGLKPLVAYSFQGPNS